ncbi:arsenate reductase (thioredoxin), partial [Lacticaseibacillus rhamnosus]|nr:arsenate reductase (thioredoxin) [Lacticaseibacillus rhamnosus]
DRCPVTPPTVRRLHWPLADPAAASGSQEAVLAVFRQVRDQIEAHVRALKADA